MYRYTLRYTLRLPTWDMDNESTRQRTTDYRQRTRDNGQRTTDNESTRQLVGGSHL